MSQLHKGIVQMLIATFFFAWMTAFVRLISPPVSVSVILFFQSVAGLLFMLPQCIKDRTVFQTSKLPLIFFRSSVSLLSLTFLFLSAQRVPLTTAVLLNNCAPLFIPFIVRVWKKTPIDHLLWPGILIGLAGIVLILKPGADLLHPGALFGIVSALMLGSGMVTMRVLSHTEKSRTVLTYYFLMTAILVFPFAVLNWTPLTPMQIGIIAANSIVSTAGQWCLFRAFTHAKASYLGPFTYAAVVYAAIIQWLIYNSFLDWMSCVGIVLVCLGGIWTTKRAKNAQ